jgi:phenylacetate-CoA ligase
MFNLFHLSLKLSGFPIAKAQAVFEKIQQILVADYPDYLGNKKREIVEFHFRNNPFYQNLVGKDKFDN